MTVNPGKSSPGTQIVDTFLEATIAVPQVPYGGIIEVGDAALRLMNSQLLSWREFVYMGLSGPRLRYAITETVRSHGVAGIGNNQGLRRSLPFAFELVQSGVAGAVDALRRGDDTAEMASIPPVTDYAVEVSEAFLFQPQNRRFLRTLFGAVRERVAGRDVTQELERYREAITEVSAAYRDVPRGNAEGAAAKIRALNTERGRLMAVASPAILEAVQPFSAERPGVIAFAAAVACVQPSPELVQKHFPPEQQPSD